MRATPQRAFIRKVMRTPLPENTSITPCGDLAAAIETQQKSGFRLEMIFPADDPREALMSRDGERILLTSAKTAPHDEGEWIRGRAGMEYRDLIPNRPGGKVIASHIRLTEGGEVPDYVHYHKIDFQVIYCLKGRIKVAYEDHGEPFWLERGDLVLQPPEIRHRVLECTGGAEVIEITSPAEHETWVEHEMDLPNGRVDPTRTFGGKRFFRHKFRESDARDQSEQKLVDLANAIANSSTEDEILNAVTTFSRSLAQT